MDFLRNIIAGGLSLTTGMKVTLKHFFRPTVTTQYPHERLEMSPAYRNVIVLIEKEDISSHDCIACAACERVCPSFCIKLAGEKPEGLKRQRVTEFTVDFALCSECGLCLDACPTDTLGYSREYDQAGYSRKDFLYDLLEPWRNSEAETVERLRRIEVEKVEAKKKAAEAKKKAAEAKKEKAAEEDGGQEEDA